MLHRLPTATLLALLLGAAAPAQRAEPAPDERVETWPDGSPKRRYTVDEQGREHGKVEGFAADGTRTLLAFYAHGLRDGDWKEWRADGTKLRSCRYHKDVLHGPFEECDAQGRPTLQGSYRDGKRNGAWTETSADGRRRRVAEYRDDVLHGAVRVQLDGKVLTRQVWKDGELQQLDDLQPFPTRRADLLRELEAILRAPPPAPDPKDPLAESRAAALRRLMAYRRLCGLPWAGMTLAPEWNLRCDAAAEACRRLGRLDHHPPRPDGMDQARYALAADGAGHSNLAISASLAQSVDQYLDDSDAGNIDRIGHRRWCLNPVMKRTGFGSDGGFHAMWSMDASGSAPKGVDAVLYPPRGYVPVDLFGPRRAFSILLLRGGVPKPDELRPRVRALDADYVPAGEPLPLDWCAVAAPGYGSGACLVFRPAGIAVEPDRRYLVEVSTDGGRTDDFRYVVEFCPPVDSPR